MISKMGYWRRGRNQIAAQARLQPKQAPLQQSPGALWLLLRAQLQPNKALGPGKADTQLLVQFNCGGAKADARAGLKAEMDAPGWQRSCRRGEREGTRTDRHLAWKPHTWSLQDVAPCGRGSPADQPQGRFPTLGSVSQARQ